MVLQLDSGGHSLSTFNNSSTAVTPASTDLQMSDVIHVVSGKTTLVNTSQPMITNNVDSDAAGEILQQVNGPFIMHIIVNFLTNLKNKQKKTILHDNQIPLLLW